MLEKKLSEETVHEIVRDAVAIETGFITEALPCALIGMNAGMMTTYIHTVADRLLVELGYSKIWNAVNPFEWMEMISLQGKTNFFEKKVTDYQKAGVLAASQEKIDNNAISFDEDF